MTNLAVLDAAPLALAPTLTPAEHIAYFTDVANALTDVVEQKKVFSMISGKKYLKAEAWQTVVSLDGAHPITDWVKPIMMDSEIIGYEAQVSIFKNGERIATGIMPCGFDDFPCKGKIGVARDRACESTAQTWAGSKAARMKYAWVVVLAGYEPTPAEEMTADINTTRSRPHNRRQTTQEPSGAGKSPESPSPADYTAVLKEGDEYGLSETAFLKDIIRQPTWEAFEKLGGSPEIAEKRLASWIESNA